MLVVIDIGNTSITIGIYYGGKLIGNYHLTTKMKHTSDEYGFVVMNFLNASKVQPTDIRDVIISNVVPKIMHFFLNGTRKYIYKESILVGPGIKTGISAEAEDPKTVGADRIVDAAGVYYEYGGPYLTVNYGTATTFDYVGANGNFEHGVTTLGTETGAQAMWTQVTKFPEVEVRKPASILAKAITTSMQVGLVYGCIGQSEYTIKEFKKALGVDTKAIATGDLRKVIYKNTDEIDICNHNLTFKGLKYIYKKYTTEKERQASAVKEFTP